MSRRVVTALAGTAAIVATGQALLGPWRSAVIPPESNTTVLWLIRGDEALALFDSPVLLTLGLVGSVSYMVLRFLLWWQARGGPGSVLLLCSAIVGLIPLAARPVLLGAMSLSGDFGVRLIVVIESFAGRWGLLVEPLAFLLMSAGILRAGIAPRWVGLLGLASAVSLGVANAIARSGSWGIEVAWLAVPEQLFLLVLGCMLILDARPLSASQPSNNGIEQSARR